MLTDVAVSSMQRAARQVPESHALIAVSNRGQHAFVAALMNPPKPSKELRAAAKR